MASALRDALPSVLSSQVEALELVALDLGLPPDAATWAFFGAIGLLVGLLVGLLLVVAQLLSLRRTKDGRSVGSALLLCGYCGSGKTALFHRLRANAVPHTVTSLEPSDKTFALHPELGGGGEASTLPRRPIRVLDMPGHGRLRTKLMASLPDARGVVFLVDAADTSATSLRPVAELLYDVFEECVRSNCGPRVLVVCNKSDREGAISGAALKTLLEAEMDTLKSTRHSIETEGGDSDDIILGTDGEKFDLEYDGGVEIEFAECSVKEGALDAVLGFVEALGFA